MEQSRWIREARLNQQGPCAGIDLAVGDNVITVTGTNLLGVVADDTVTITRGGIGTGEPYVDITNASDWVTYDVKSYTIAGTNNIHVVGTMTWSNPLSGDSGTLPASAAWTIAGIDLAVGEDRKSVV